MFRFDPIDGNTKDIDRKDLVHYQSRIALPTWFGRTVRLITPLQAWGGREDQRRIDQAISLNYNSTINFLNRHLSPENQLSRGWFGGWLGGDSQETIQQRYNEVLQHLKEQLVEV